MGNSLVWYDEPFSFFHNEKRMLYDRRYFGHMFTPFFYPLINWSPTLYFNAKLGSLLAGINKWLVIRGYLNSDLIIALINSCLPLSGYHLATRARQYGANPSRLQFSTGGRVLQDQRKPGRWAYNSKFRTGTCGYHLNHSFQVTSCWKVFGKKLATVKNETASGLATTNHYSLLGINNDKQSICVTDRGG